MGPPRLTSREAWRSAGLTDVVGKGCGGSEGAGEDWRALLLSEMDKRRRRLARSPKMYWWVAKGVLSLSGADTALGVVLDDVSTSARKCGGVGIPSGDDDAEVAEVGCNPASLSIGAGVVIPEGIWERLKLMAGDGCLGVSPSSFEGLEVKDLRGGDEDSEVMPSLSCILRLLMRIGRCSAVPGFPFRSLTGFPILSLALAPWAQSISTAFSARITFLWR